MYWTKSVMVPLGPGGKKVNACTTNSLCKPSCGCHAQPKCYITCPTACVATAGCAWKPGKGCHPPEIVSSAPTFRPTEEPTSHPTNPTPVPTFQPTDHPSTSAPTNPTTANPTPKPQTANPTPKPETGAPTTPTESPTEHPTANPTNAPTKPCDFYETAKSCTNAGCFWTEKLLVKGDNGKNYDACKTDALCKKSCGCHAEEKCYITCPTACEANSECTWVPEEGCEPTE